PKSRSSFSGSRRSRRTASTSRRTYPPARLSPATSNATCASRGTTRSAEQPLDQPPQLPAEFLRRLRRVFLSGQDPLPETVDPSRPQPCFRARAAAPEPLERSGDGALLRVAPVLGRLAQLGSSSRLEPELVFGRVGDPFTGGGHELVDQPVGELPRGTDPTE